MDGTAVFALGNDAETFRGVAVNQRVVIGWRVRKPIENLFVAGRYGAVLEANAADEGRILIGVVGVAEKCLVRGHDVDPGQTVVDIER